ncbi:MAG: hypothetical protein CM15mV60_360 [uncultured marine virus]|nr:MAG: hypothetical protein CM15mV60_360 [uncultured marine virus]
MAELPQFKKLVDMLYACQKTIYEQEHLDSEPVLGNMWANIKTTRWNEQSTSTSKLFLVRCILYQST